MFLKLKALSNGSAGAYNSASYNTVLVNTAQIVGFVQRQVVDTAPSTGLPQGAEGYPNVINAVKIGFGNEDGIPDLVAKAYFGPQTAPANVGTGNGTMSIPVVNQAFGATFTGTISGTTLTVASITTGNNILVGQFLNGPGVAANTQILALGTGSGGNGTYTVSVSQTVGPVIMSSSALGGSGVAQVETITATCGADQKTFTVVGSVGGTYGTAVLANTTNGTSVTFNGGGVSFTITNGSVAFANTDVFTFSVKSTLTQLANYLESADYTGTPAFVPMQLPTRGFAKYNHITNVLSPATGSDTAISYINPTNFATISTFGAYFLGSAPTVTGTGNGTMSVPVISPDYCPVDTFTVTFTSATAYQMTNSASAVIGTGTFGATTNGSISNFSAGGISFTLTEGSTPFATNDSFSITTTAGTALQLAVPNNLTRYSSAPISTWTTGLQPKDIELTTTEIVSSPYVLSSVYHTGGVGIPSQAITVGTNIGVNLTPVVTESYIAEVFIPGHVTLTGISFLAGTVQANGNVKVALADATGAIVASSASTANAAFTANAYNKVAFTSTYAAKGPGKYFVIIKIDNTTDRLAMHFAGNFGAAKTTGGTYAAAFSTIVPPTTFTTGVGPIADVY